MTSNERYKKVVVVLSPDLVKPENPLESTLLSRAVEFARTTGYELELFHVCYDGTLETNAVVSAREAKAHREKLIDRDATLLAEIATRLKCENVKVTYEVRWDAPRSDAILRKIAQCDAELVMKQAREHNYILGFSTNTDWELARRSATSVWFVSSEKANIERIVAAAGIASTDDGELANSSDFELLRTAGLMGDSFKAEIYPVNAFQSADAYSFMVYSGTFALPAKTTQIMDASRDQLARRHEDALVALSRQFDIPESNVQVREGRPHRVIPEVAESVDADMIVMGAQSLGRWERLISPVTVEPVMAASDCDVVVVREGESVAAPEADVTPLYGVPKIDLEDAVTKPEATFGTPEAVAKAPEISVGLRKRILQAWEYDVRAEMTEVNEGGPVTDVNVDLLDEIHSALGALEDGETDAGADRPRLHAAS